MQRSLLISGDTMQTARRVLARYLEASRSVEAFGKFHPVFDVVRKAGKVLQKAFAAAKRYAQIASKADSYKGDKSRVQPNAEKSWQAVDEMLKVAETIDKPVGDFIREYGQNLDSDYRKRVHADLMRWHEAMQKEIQDIRHNNSYYKEREVQQSFGVSLFDTWRDKLYSATYNLISSTEMAAKIPLEGPGKVDPNASPEERFRAHITPAIVTMAKASAKKLGNKPGPCAVLAGDVLEDVNAHSELRSLMGLLKHYYDAITEEERGAVRSLVGRVSTALDWDILAAGAFAAAIMKVSGAPETERVIDTLSKAFDKYTKG